MRGLNRLSVCVWLSSFRFGLVFVEGALEKWLLRGRGTWEGTVKACGIEVGLGDGR